jgi:hypothetical protein
LKKENPRKRLTDYIDIERDILPNNVTAIYAGTNAGKTTLIEGYHDGNVDFFGLAEKYKVLFITSRRQKVKQTCCHQESFLRHLEEAGAIIYWDNCNKNVVCTNAHIHQYISQHYVMANEATYFWRHFDFVVVDEVHSICNDSSYAQCSYTVKCLIEKIAEEQKRGKTKTKLLLMTATPQTIRWFVEQLDAKVYDYLDVLKPLKPKSISVVGKDYMHKEMLSLVRQGKTVVYYLSHIEKMPRLIQAIAESGISETEISVAISDKEVLKKIQNEYPIIYDNAEDLSISVSIHEEIDSQFKLVLTNGKWREAINITNVVDCLIIESHYSIDLQQIIGRFRNGVGQVFLIRDAQQFENYNNFSQEWDYYSQRMDYDNAELKKRIFGAELPKKYEPIMQNTETKRFVDTLLRQSRYRGINLLKECFEANMAYKKYLEHFNHSKYAIQNALDANLDFSEVDNYFKDIAIDYGTEQSANLAYIEKLFERENLEFGKTEISKEKLSEIVSMLIENLNNNGKPIKCKKPKTVLAKYGCGYTIIGKTIKGRCIIYKLRALNEPPIDILC